jgi:hypothetical protein
MSDAMTGGPNFLLHGCDTPALPRCVAAAARVTVGDDACSLGVVIVRRGPFAITRRDYLR